MAVSSAILRNDADGRELGDREPPRSIPGTGYSLMEYRRQVAIRRDGDDCVVAIKPDDVIVFRSRDADALRKVCGSLRWEIVSDTTVSANDLMWSLAPAQTDPD